MISRSAHQVSAVVTVVLIFVTAGYLKWFVIPLLLPAGFLIWARIRAGTPCHELTPRVYLMYFLLGMLGLLSEARLVAGVFSGGSELGDAVAAAGLAADAASNTTTADPSRIFLLRLPDVVRRVLTPLICGVAVYVLFGTGRAVESAPPLTTSHLDQLNQLLQRARIPEAAAVLMQQLVTQTERIHAESVRFSESVASLAGTLKAFDHAIADSQRQCRDLTRQMADFSQGVGAISSSVSSLHRDVDSTSRDVREFAHVFNEFSSIAASRILNFSEPLLAGSATHAE